jgi:hypothetical protein
MTNEQTAEPVVDATLVEFARLTRLTPTMSAELRRLILAGRYSTARRRWRQHLDRCATLADQVAALALWDPVSDIAWERSPRLKQRD